MMKECYEMNKDIEAHNPNELLNIPLSRSDPPLIGTIPSFCFGTELFSLFFT